MKNEPKDAMQEDFLLIKNILSKTFYSFKSVSSFFTWLAAAFALYAISIYCIYYFTARSMISQHVIGLEALSVAQIIIVLIFPLSLIFIYYVWREKAKEHCSSSCGLELLDMWGISIVLYILMTLVIEIFAPASRNYFKNSLNLNVVDRIDIAMGYSSYTLNTLFPALPMAITGIWVRKKKLVTLGLISFLISALYILRLLIRIDVSSLTGLSWFAMQLLYSGHLLLPAVFLFIFQIVLKRDKSGSE